MLSVTRFSAGYRSDVPIVRDVEVEVAPGEAVGVIGRNGAGKTCFALSLMGALPTMGGSVAVAGTEVTRASTRGRISAGLSIVPEGRMVFPQLTVRENLVAALYGAGRRKLSDSRFAEICDRFPVLKRKAEDRAASLSGGEQQLLAVGRALIQEPGVIVLDEPSMGLSPSAIGVLGDELIKIRDSGVALLIMEQSPDLLRRLCSRVHVVDQGRIQHTYGIHSMQDDEQLASVLLSSDFASSSYGVEK